jgi:hypothetical protein
MKPKKTKPSTSKQLAKKSAKKPKQDKAPTKGNTCKQQVSDGRDDSDDDIAQSRPKRKQQNKSKHVKEVDEEETEAIEPEEIVESDDNDRKVPSEEEPEGNDKVSQLQMIVRNNDNSPDKRMKN